MEPRLSRLSLAVIVAFAAFQFGGVAFPTDAFTQGWLIVLGYLAAAIYAVLTRAPLAALAAVSVAVVRGMVTLHITGLPFNVASMAFADLFFVLVIFESEYHRIAQMVERARKAQAP